MATVVGYTIGEVLNQLKPDFEDLTISKIRFLESEGLIQPERTDSGYRKFSDDDVERLRFVLTAQRDHYLPLKVIRSQLERLDAGERLEPRTPAPAPEAAPDAVSVTTVVDGREIATATDRGTEVARVLDQALAGRERFSLAQPAERVSLSLREFCDATGLEPGQVRELRDFGLVGRRGQDLDSFDGDELVAAKAVHGMLERGLEPRHLRMFGQFTDRQMALFEQLVTPLLRQRSSGSRVDATTQLEDLVTLSGQLTRALLTRALRNLIHGA